MYSPTGAGAARALRTGFRICAVSIATFAMCSAAIADGVGSMGVRWWQHALSIPADQNPILDQTGANCGFGQQGDTWFLHGSFSETIVRNCNAPAGRRFFLPVFNWICLPFPGETVRENADICRFLNDATDTLELTIDGVNANELIKRRARRKAFDITLPDGNVFGFAAGTYVAVHDGYFAMLPVLSPGEHTVRIIGNSSAFSPAPVDVTYNLTVSEAVFVNPGP